MPKKNALQDHCFGTRGNPVARQSKDGTNSRAGISTSELGFAAKLLVETACLSRIQLFHTKNTVGTAARSPTTEHFSCESSLFCWLWAREPRPSLAFRFPPPPMEATSARLCNTWPKPLQIAPQASRRSESIRHLAICIQPDWRQPQHRALLQPRRLSDRRAGLGQLRRRQQDSGGDSCLFGRHRGPGDRPRE